MVVLHYWSKRVVRLLYFYAFFQRYMTLMIYQMFYKARKNRKITKKLINKQKVLDELVVIVLRYSYLEKGLFFCAQKRGHTNSLEGGKNQSV